MGIFNFSKVLESYKNDAFEGLKFRMMSQSIKNVAWGSMNDLHNLKYSFDNLALNAPFLNCEKSNNPCFYVIYVSFHKICKS